MSASPLAAQVAELRRFFAYRNPTAWAKVARPGLDEAEIQEAHKQELKRARRAVEEFVHQLADAGESAILTELTAGAPQELLLAVCAALQAKPWGDAVPVLLQQFNRNPNTQVRIGLLELVTQSGAVEGYVPATAARAAKERSLWATAKRAKQAIRKAHPAVAWLEQIETDPSAPLEDIAPDQIIATLLLIQGVPTAIRLLAALPGANSGAWERLLPALIDRATQPTSKAKEADEAPRKAAQILAGLSSDLPEAAQKVVRRVFLSTAEKLQAQILQAARPDAVRGLIEACLGAQAKVVKQGLTELAEKRRDLIPSLRQELQRLTAHQDVEIARQALALTGETPAGTGGTARVRYRRMLSPDTPMSSERRFGLLLAAAEGRAALVEAGMTEALWTELALWVRSSHPVPGLDELYSLLAQELDSTPAERERRLLWLIAQSDLVGPESAAAARPILERTVASATLFWGEDSFHHLCAALGGALPLWASVAPAVLPLVTGAQPGHVRQLLALQPPGELAPEGLIPMLSQLEAQLETALTVVADLKGGALAEAQRWLEGQGGAFVELMQRVVRQSHSDVLEARKRLRTLWEQEWKAQASNINRLIAEVERALAPHLSTHPHWEEPLAILMTQLGRAVFDREPPSPEGLPRPVSADKEPLLAYREALLVRREIASRLQGERERLRTAIGTDAAPTVEAVVLLFHGTEAVQAVSYQILRWISGLGLSPVEPLLGPGPHYSPSRHEATTAPAPGAPVSVLAWGLMRGDTVIRRALVESI